MTVRQIRNRSIAELKDWLKELEWTHGKWASRKRSEIKKYLKENEEKQIKSKSDQIGSSQAGDNV